MPNDINNNIDVFLACNPFDATQCAPLPDADADPDRGRHPLRRRLQRRRQVTIDDLIRMVNIALGLRSVCGDDGGIGQCLAGDANCDCEITVDEIIRAVNNSLNGCTDFGDCTLERTPRCAAAARSTPRPRPRRRRRRRSAVHDAGRLPARQVCIDGYCVRHADGRRRPRGPSARASATAAATAR